MHVYMYVWKIGKGPATSRPNEMQAKSCNIAAPLKKWKSKKRFMKPKRKELRRTEKQIKNFNYKNNKSFYKKMCKQLNRTCNTFTISAAPIATATHCCCCWLQCVVSVRPHS